MKWIWDTAMDMSNYEPAVHRGAVLRSALAGPRPALAIGAHDAVGATLGERAGFDAIWASGLEISTCRGVADANILTREQSAEAASIMAGASSLPVLADCDNGFGGVDAVRETVRCFERRGVAGICLEDKAFPKLNSFAEGPQTLESIPSFVRKIEAACKAKTSDEFVIVARVEALIAGENMQAAHRRADAYVSAGADAILIHSKSSTPHEVIEFAERFDKKVPLLVVPTKYPGVTLEELGQAGVSMAIYANQGLRAAISAMRKAFDEIRTMGNSLSIESTLVSVDYLLEMYGTDDVAATAANRSRSTILGDTGQLAR